MYTRLGYSVYRRVLEYYSGDPDEDAFGKISKIYYQMFIYQFFVSDMRKALPRDKHKKSIIPLQHPVRPEELE